MRIRAEMRCLNCGRFLGDLEGEQRDFYRNAQVATASPTGAIVKTGNGFRCSHCGGKAFAETVERVRTAA